MAQLDAIEMQEISRKKEEKAASPIPDALGDAANHLIPAACLFVMGFLFTFFPGFIFYLAAPALNNTISALERFFAIQLGIEFIALSVSFILDTTSHPLLIPQTIASSISAFQSYNSTSATHSLGILLFITHLLVALSGYWTILFANEQAISKTTGADKHTSAFIFGNSSAASQIKKAWRRKQDDKERNR